MALHPTGPGKGGASQVKGLPELALGKFQTNQDEFALLDGVIRGNKYPFVETISIPLRLPKSIGRGSCRKLAFLPSLRKGTKLVGC